MSAYLSCFPFLGKVRKIGILFCLSFCLQPVLAQEDLANDRLYQLAIQDLDAFAHAVTAEDLTGLDQAETIVNWFALHFDWTYTDYQQRSVAEIVARKGGNCSELARVTQACLETLDIPIRRIREINLHIPTPRRQVTAEQKVQELGLRASVFGHRHNDHVWLEIYDNQSESWIPADPSLGVVGTRMWLAARYAFGKRYSLDPTSADMIAPFAIFTQQDDQWISLTEKYAIDGFNELYYGELSKLEHWPVWVEQIRAMDGLALRAFQGQSNLHEHTVAIKSLHDTYHNLKNEFLKTDLGQIHSEIDAFSDALVRGDYDAVVAAYTLDARIFPNNTPILAGEKSIRQYWTPPPSRTSRTIHHRIIPEEIKINGREAYDWGYYEGRTWLEDGTELPWRGKYVIIWKKTEDDQWKIYLDIWNRVAD